MSRFPKRKHRTNDENTTQEEKKFMINEAIAEFSQWAYTLLNINLFFSMTIQKCVMRRLCYTQKRFYSTWLCTHLKTATSFLNPCNCWGLGSETFNVLIATAPKELNKTLRLPILLYMHFIIQQSQSGTSIWKGQEFKLSPWRRPIWEWLKISLTPKETIFRAW